MTRGGSSLYLVSYSIVRPFFRHKPLFPEIQEKVSYVQSMSVIRCVVRLILIVLQWVHCNALRKALFVSSWTSVTFFFFWFSTPQIGLLHENVLVPHQ